MIRDAWVEAKLRELAKQPLPEPTVYNLARAAHHASGSFTIEHDRL
jgi:hypothetical protein